MWTGFVDQHCVYIRIEYRLYYWSESGEQVRGGRNPQANIFRYPSFGEYLLSKRHLKLCWPVLGFLAMTTFHPFTKLPSDLFCKHLILRHIENIRSYASNKTKGICPKVLENWIRMQADNHYLANKSTVRLSSQPTLPWHNNDVCHKMQPESYCLLAKVSGLKTL